MQIRYDLDDDMYFWKAAEITRGDHVALIIGEYVGEFHITLQVGI